MCGQGQSLLKERATLVSGRVYKISLSYTHMCVSVHGRRRGRYKPFQVVGKSLAASRLSKRLTVQKQYSKPGQEHNEITVKEAGAGLCWGPRGTPRVPAPLPLSPFSPPDRDRTGTSGFLSVSDSDRRVPAELGQESQASSCLRKGAPPASRVAQGVSPRPCWAPGGFPTTLATPGSTTGTDHPPTASGISRPRGCSGLGEPRPALPSF